MIEDSIHAQPTRSGNLSKEIQKEKMLDGLTKGPEVARVTDALRRIKKARGGGGEGGGKLCSTMS